MEHDPDHEDCLCDHLMLAAAERLADEVAEHLAERDASTRRFRESARIVDVRRDE